MFEWITVTIGLAASILFAEYWMHSKHLRLIRLCTSVAAGVAVYFIFWAFWREGAFLSAMLAGQMICLLYDFLHRGRQLLIPEICFYLSYDSVWVPLCLCGNDIWQYAVYFSVFVLCLSLALMSMSGEKYLIYRLADFYVEKREYYWMISFLPCFIIVPESLVLLNAKEPSIISGLSLSVVFLLLCGLVLCLQMEMLHRFNAEYLNRAMTRWQRESRDYMNTIRSQRHDYNLHLHAVSGLISSGNYAECQQYVQKLVSQANDVNDIMPVSDPVVGSMLYNMREKARRQGTDILYHITYDMEDILCNGFECNKIIGNLLQNAIDALQTPEDKEFGIRLKILKRRGNTVIISENRFTDDPDCIARVFEPGFSTKKGHEGIGLSMVLRTAQRYGGRVYPEFEQDIIRFVVNIPNKVNLQKGG